MAAELARACFSKLALSIEDDDKFNTPTPVNADVANAGAGREDASSGKSLVAS